MSKSKNNKKEKYMKDEKTTVFSVEHQKKHKDTIDTFADCDTAHTCSTVGYYVERIAYLENLVKKYKFDHLTGLMMKADFEDKFDRVFEEYQFADMPFHMAIIDIDGLHNTNRQKGYHAGDQLIRNVAHQLQELFSFNQVYRISGDEFVAIARQSVISFEDFEKAVDKIENVTVYVDGSNGYTSPSHMFKAIDKKLADKKAKKKTERL
jgi:diguanylate cyclase (GGDEF)-like protein